MSPILSVIASIIPGLGFLLLGRWRSALITWVCFIPFFPLFLLTSQMDSSKCFSVSLIYALAVYILQGVRVYKLARILEQGRHGETVLLNKVDPHDILSQPGNDYLKQRLIFGKRLATHVLPGESLLEWVVGEDHPRQTLWGDRNVCVGLLDQDLLVCEYGCFDFPETVRRLPRANLHFTVHAGTGRKLLWIIDQQANEKKSIILSVDRENTPALIRLAELTQASPMYKTPAGVPGNK